MVHQLKQFSNKWWERIHLYSGKLERRQKKRKRAAIPCEFLVGKMIQRKT